MKWYSYSYTGTAHLFDSMMKTSTCSVGYRGRADIFVLARGVSVRFYSIREDARQFDAVSKYVVENVLQPTSSSTAAA